MLKENKMLKENEILKNAIYEYWTLSTWEYETTPLHQATYD